MSKLVKEEITELIFTAKLVSDDVENRDREFVIRMSIIDDEIKIWENETPGFRGGFFYKSPHYREKAKFDPSRAFIGSKINVNLNTFLLVDAPDSTLDYMESQPDTFPYSDLSVVLDKIRHNSDREELRKKFEKYDQEKIGRILLDEAKLFFHDEFTDLNEQEIRTVLRRYQFYNTNRFDYNEFLVSL